MACLGKIEGVTKRDRPRNTVIQEWLSLTRDIIARTWQRRLQYIGCVVQMEQALEGYVHQRRSRGRPKRRWLDEIKEDVESLNITIHGATSTAQDQATWRRIQRKLPLRAS